MHPLAKLAANNAMMQQGQPCKIISVLAPESLAIDARCIARPSLDESFGARISGEKYDVTVLRENKLRTGDLVQILDEDGDVEMELTISQPTAQLSALRVYIGVPL